MYIRYKKHKKVLLEAVFVLLQKQYVGSMCQITIILAYFDYCKTLNVIFKEHCIHMKFKWDSDLRQRQIWRYWNNENDKIPSAFIFSINRGILISLAIFIWNIMGEIKEL